MRRLLAVLLLGTALAPAPAAAQDDSVRIRFECPSCGGRARVGIAFLETVGVQIGVNLINQFIIVDSSQDVTPETWGRNLREGWEFDANHFSTNQFAHPYHGNINFNTARSNGLDYWSSIPFAGLGSLIWEYFGEIHRPSLNDYISTTVGGIALGELTFQLSTLVLDNQATGKSRFWKEMAALAINPARGVNRFLFGDWDRVGPNPPDRTPELMRGGMRAGFRIVDKGSGLDKGSFHPFITFDVLHGDPFEQAYTKPFDVFLFNAQVNAAESKVLGRLSAYGRLYRKRLDSGERPRHALLVTQNYDYYNTDAYKLGGQSVDVGVMSRFDLNSRLRLTTTLMGKGIILAAVNSEFEDGPNRDYDFGPGLGISVGGILSRGGLQLARLSYAIQTIHNVNGLAGNHYLHEAVVDASLPLSPKMSVGGQGLFYHRRSNYRDLPSVTQDTPEIQAYLRWRF
ncbi:MAG: hypothetical protein K0S19_2097 [Geminicoccaceae bacterium]|nr:hypothetical protein [Geminicoccaceae bacterium]